MSQKSLNWSHKHVLALLQQITLGPKFTTSVTTSQVVESFILSSQTYKPNTELQMDCFCY